MRLTTSLLAAVLLCLSLVSAESAPDAPSVVVRGGRQNATMQRLLAHQPMTRDSLPRPDAMLVQRADRSSISSNMSVISSQIKLGREYELQAIEALAADGVAAAANARNLAHQGYVQLRWAAHNINRRMETARFTDPLLEFVLGKIERAREYNRDAISKLDQAANGAGPAAVTAALEQLDHVVAILEETMFLVP